MVILVLLLVIAFLFWKLTKTQQDGRAAYEHVALVERQIRELAEQSARDAAKRSARAVAASRGNYDGHVAEQFFPASPQHPYHPKDIFHFGGIIDYIVFDGLYAVRHEGRDPQTVSVVLVDVKWGSSRSTDAQQAVLSAVASGRMRAETWHGRGGPDGALSYRRKEITGK